jgi:hypothetical protein
MGDKEKARKERRTVRKREKLWSERQRESAESET